MKSLKYSIEKSIKLLKKILMKTSTYCLKNDFMLTRWISKVRGNIILEDTLSIFTQLCVEIKAKMK